MSGRRRGAFALVLALALVGGWLANQQLVGWPPRTVLRPHGENVSLAFSSDGATLATSDSKEITLWNAADGRKRSSWAIPEHRTIYRGTFTPDGRTLISLSDEAVRKVLVVDLFDMATGHVRASTPTLHRGRLGLALADDGKTVRSMVITQGTPAEIELVDADVATGRPISSRLLTCPEPGPGLIISHDGRLMAAAPKNEIVPDGPSRSDAFLWDLILDREIARFSSPSGAARIKDLGLTRDGKTLGISREDGSYELWEIAARRLRSTHQIHDSEFYPVVTQLAPDGSKLASIGQFLANRRPRSIRSLRAKIGFVPTRKKGELPLELIIFDLCKDRHIGRAIGEYRPIFSADGRFLASDHLDGTGLAAVIVRAL